jgi:hypothetical protein
MKVDARTLVQLAIAVGFVALGIAWLTGPDHTGPGLAATVVGLGMATTTVLRERRSARRRS